MREEIIAAKAGISEPNFGAINWVEVLRVLESPAKDDEERKLDARLVIAAFRARRLRKNPVLEGIIPDTDDAPAANNGHDASGGRQYESKLTNYSLDIMEGLTCTNLPVRTNLANSDG